MPRRDGSGTRVNEEPTPAHARTHRIVRLSLGIQVPQTAALGAAAAVMGSSAVFAQTFAAIADLAVQVFLAVGVRASSRVSDSTHPLGYGRERYFWSLFAAIAIFVGGFTVVVAEALRSALHPDRVTSFTLGYGVLAAGILLDGVAFAAALRETRRRAREKGRSVPAYLRRTTEPATGTELVGNGIGFGGGIVAIIALAVTQATGSPSPNTIASALIGLALMAAALALTQQNRAILTGRGIDPVWLERMRSVIQSHPGVVDVPDLFAIVIGPSTLIVDGDVTFEVDLTVPAVEAALEGAAVELTSRWPEARYIYLTPVGESRRRGSPPSP